MNSEARTKFTFISDYVCNKIELKYLQKIQKDLPRYDLISLVFLLYDVPATAQQDVVRLERIPDPGSLCLLRDWALDAMKTDIIEWKFKFLESLVVCRLFMVIRKLGFDVNEVRLYFEQKEKRVLNPVKVVLYNICEQIDAKILIELRQTFATFNIISNNQTCESLFLELMVQKVIIADFLNKTYDLRKLLKVIEVFPSLNLFSNYLKLHHVDSSMMTSNINTTCNSENKGPHDKTDLEDNKFYENFNDINDLADSLRMATMNDIQSDSKNCFIQSYEIKNPRRVGICYIINQEQFYPSNHSIKNHCKYLIDREGSAEDKILLQKTFKNLNFHVETSENLNHGMFIKKIRDVVKHTVTPDDSVFVICIMSHGIKGHIYTCDSIPVSIEKIQNVLGAEANLHNIPKVMILQACQVNDDQLTARIESDSPNKFLELSDFVIYWATAPKLEAYRDIKKGSIFIQLLCYMLQKYASQENLYDIITKVNDKVSTLCANINKTQVPLFESTLRKKLYFKMPVNKK